MGGLGPGLAVVLAVVVQCGRGLAGLGVARAGVVVQCGLGWAGAVVQCGRGWARAGAVGRTGLSRRCHLLEYTIPYCSYCHEQEMIFLCRLS